MFEECEVGRQAERKAPQFGIRLGHCYAFDLFFSFKDLSMVPEFLLIKDITVYVLELKPTQFLTRCVDKEESSLPDEPETGERK